MDDLEEVLQDAGESTLQADRYGWCFFHGRDHCQVDRICDLAEKYNALVMVDDSHATGFVGKTGRGTIEHWQCSGKGGYHLHDLREGLLVGHPAAVFLDGRRSLIFSASVHGHIYSQHIGPCHCRRYA